MICFSLSAHSALDFTVWQTILDYPALAKPSLTSRTNFRTSTTGSGTFTKHASLRFHFLHSHSHQHKLRKGQCSLFLPKLDNGIQLHTGPGTQPKQHPHSTAQSKGKRPTVLSKLGEWRQQLELCWCSHWCQWWVARCPLVDDVLQYEWESLL